jgi:membrane protein involved in colicin uptake
MTSGTGAMFPEAQADVDEAARLKADIDAKAQAANTTLDEATTRAKALTEKLSGQAGSGKGEADAGKGEEAADKGKSPKPAKGAKSAKGAEDAKPEKAAAEPK